MFLCSRPSFATLASRLYSPGAFESPPEAQSPDLPADWMSYTEVPTGPAFEAFQHFMLGDAFKRIQAQFRARIAQCIEFAEAHCHPRDATAVRSGFGRFKTHLDDGDGLTYFNLDLPLLYGLGKRSFDSFCHALADDSIDLQLRRDALVELAYEVRNCRVTAGVARALRGLDQSLGGLRGEFSAVFRSLLDAQLLEFVRRHPIGGANFLDAGEIHVVNRLKLELQLGGDPADRYSRDACCAMPGHLLHLCAQVLLHRVRPTDVALRMADNLFERLTQAAADRAGVSASDMDASQVAHMDALMSAFQGWRATYQGVQFSDLVEEEVASGRFHLRTDRSLAAYSLLVELARQGLVISPCMKLRPAGQANGERWQLCVVDDRLFFLSAGPVSPGGVQASVGLDQLSRGRPEAFPRPWRSRLVRTAIEAERADRLPALPLNLLTHAAQVGAMLRRLGPQRSVSWVQGQPLTDSALALLLPEAANAGHEHLMQHLLARSAGRSSAHLLRLAGGPEIINTVVSHGQLSILTPWLKVLGEAMPALPADEREAVLKGPGQKYLTHSLLQAGHEKALQPLLDWLLTMREAGQIGDALLLEHLAMPFLHAMASRRHQALGAAGRAVMTAAGRGYVTGPELQSLLQGNEEAGNGYGVAIAHGGPEAMRWLHDCAAEAVARQLLSPAQFVEVLYGNESTVAVITAAAATNQVDELKLLVELLKEDLDGGRIAREHLPRLLSINERQTASDWRVAAFGWQDSRFADAWLEALIDLHRQNLLTNAEIVGLLTAERPAAPSVDFARSAVWAVAMVSMFFLGDADARANLPFHPIETRLTTWRRLAFKAAKACNLTRGDVLKLLSLPVAGQPLLHVTLVSDDANSRATFNQLTECYFAARAESLIDDAGLEHLLSCWFGDRHRTSGLSFACLEGAESGAHRFISLIEKEVKVGRLSGAMALRLLKGDGGGVWPAVLGITASLNQLKTLHHILDVSQDMVRAGQMSPEDWIDLLRTLRDPRHGRLAIGERPRSLVTWFVNQAERERLIRPDKARELLAYVFTKP